MPAAGRRPIRVVEPVKTYDLSEQKVSAAQERTARIRPVAEQVLERVRTGKIKLPMLPAAAMEAMKIASDPTTDMRTLESVINADHVVAARVLAVANSASYGSLKVKNIVQALQRLGAGTIRDILHQAVMDAHIYRGAEGKALAAERCHSVWTAHASRSVCQALRIDPGFSYVCGLLHDIGRVVLLKLFADDPPAGLEEGDIPILLDKIHPVVGTSLCRDWKLPPLVAEACRRHHVYRGYEADGSGYSQIGHIIQVADRLTYHHGFGRPVTPIDIMQEASFFEIGLDPGQVTAILTELAASLAA